MLTIVSLWLHYVQNWIRNRRRPAAMKSAERLAERINQGDVAYTLPSQSPPSTTTITNTTPMPCPPSSSNHAYYHVYSGSPSVVGAGHVSRKSIPEAKRLCQDPGEYNGLTVRKHAVNGRNDTFLSKYYHLTKFKCWNVRGGDAAAELVACTNCIT